MLHTDDFHAFVTGGPVHAIFRRNPLSLAFGLTFATKQWFVWLESWYIWIWEEPGYLLRKGERQNAIFKQVNNFTIREFSFEIFNDFQATINSATQMVAMEQRAQDQGFQIDGRYEVIEEGAWKSTWVPLWGENWVFKRFSYAYGKSKSP